MTTRVHIALGSNLGDRRATLERAVERLGELGVEVEAVSSFHETEPVDAPNPQPRYLNGVLRGRFEGSARELLARLHEVEREAGRVRAERNGARTLDLDLLLFGDERSDDPRCALPHPRLEERPFVLEPLVEIDAELRLPDCGLSVRERLAQLVPSSTAGA